MYVMPGFAITAQTTLYPNNGQQHPHAGKQHAANGPILTLRQQYSVNAGRQHQLPWLATA